ncbi:MAG: hypothetical protein H6626_10885 [Pseudobdellovibrionaceae bacterium]|nr:MAG: hypothetical protein H6626_10885 [Pseudobdellovibrionaceae bacterium]
MKKILLWILAIFGTFGLSSIAGHKTKITLIELLVSNKIYDQPNAKQYADTLTPAEIQEMVEVIKSDNIRHFAGPVEWTVK